MENLKMTQTEILEHARDCGLQTIQITHSNSSYPEQLGDWGVIGFENMDEAEEFVNEHGGEIGDFFREGGWNLWHYKGHKNEMYDYLTYLNKLGDDYSIALADDSDYAAYLSGLTQYFNGDFCELDQAIKNIKEIISKKEYAGTNEVIIVRNFEFYEKINKTMMQFESDYKTYAIGVFIPKN